MLDESYNRMVKRFERDNRGGVIVEESKSGDEDEGGEGSEGNVDLSDDDSRDNYAFYKTYLKLLNFINVGLLFNTYLIL